MSCHRCFLAILALSLLLTSGLGQAQELALEKPEAENAATPVTAQDLMLFLDDVLAQSQWGNCEEMSMAVQSIAAERKMRAAQALVQLSKLELTEQFIQELQVKSRLLASSAQDCPAILSAHKDVATIALSLQKLNKQPKALTASTESEGSPES